jgi:hypothetical protein
MDVRTEVILKATLCLVALAVVLWRHLRPGKLPPERAGQMLWLMAIVAALAYSNFGQFHGRGGIHHWEQFHYFLGSKYFPELGYDGIYVASLEAERETTGRRPVQSHARDLRNNEVVPSSGLWAHAREVKARFSTDRWQAFKQDNNYFLSGNSDDYIAKIRKDHGYNPTPTWTFSARLFSRWIPASDASLSALAWIDALLLFAMFAVVFRCYGSRIGCMAVIVFGLGYAWRFDWVGGAFLRQDWLAAVGIAICMLRRERFVLAGSLVAYATMVRVFPGGFLVGPAVVALRHLLQKRQSAAWFWKLAVGFAIGVVICVIAGGLAGAGFDAWPEFFDNLEKHHGTWLTNNVGLKNLLLYDGATMRREDVRWSLPEPWIFWQEKMNRHQAQRRPLLLAATAAMLLVVAAAAWRYEADEAAVLGTAVAFAVVVLTCYYWAMLLLIPLGRGRWGPTAAWLAVNIGLFGLHMVTPAFEMIYGLMSWALVAFFLAWLGPDAWRSVREIVGNARS